MEYKFYAEFQSHQPEFDYLKSLEIEEKIARIRWLPKTNSSHFLLTSNGMEGSIICAENKRDMVSHHLKSLVLDLHVHQPSVISISPLLSLYPAQPHPYLRLSAIQTHTCTRVYLLVLQHITITISAHDQAVEGRRAPAQDPQRHQQRKCVLTYLLGWMDGWMDERTNDIP